MQSLIEILFEETFAAQQKYERFCTQYGTQGTTSLKPLYQYESLHDVIERAGLISAYTVYYRERTRRSTVCV